MALNQYKAPGMQMHIDCDAVPKVFSCLESTGHSAEETENDNKIHCKGKPSPCKIHSSDSIWLRIVDCE